MKAGRIFTGLLIVALGVVLLLNTMGFDLVSLVPGGKVWPVLLIICGILIFSINPYYQWVS